jgi:hypothetical protein
MATLIVAFRDELTPRVYTLKAQTMYKVFRHSANSYWETEEQYQERGHAQIESTAHFALIEQSLVKGNCEFFETKEDVKTFFRLLRATIQEWN